MSDIRIPYANLSKILHDEYLFVSRAKKRNENRINTYKKMIRELETENEYYSQKMSEIREKRRRIR